MISQVSIFPDPTLGTKRASERGQISIFFASSLIVLISIIAFVINIGLFVKAKINLQNATDAGAYAGAAVQARMLNRIGYMNWQMRNVYKEWMFKYYILGNLNIRNVENPGSIAGDNVDYTMEPDPNLGAAAGADRYNFPSVCLHYAGVPTNVCRKYAVPGLPRFEPTNLVGIDETTSSFIDAIVKEKSSDCSKRTQLNFNVTNMWAYNLPDTTGALGATFADAPQIAADRVGAWPKAVELAIRTRSLEYAMNRAPVTQGICTPGVGIGSCIDPRSLGSQQHYGNERPAKAYWSAYRNIGNQYDADLKSSFTLTELSPTVVEPGAEFSLSTMLMTPAAKQAGKFYVDLKLMMVNYATFFTALIARDDRYTVDGQLVKSEGACDVSKIAIPVPGYPLGFFKNPDVVTYYAVRGQGLFQGLFNPFSQPIKLTAYAAAKPFGGRIGPALFRENAETRIASRTTATKKRSTGYLSGLDLVGLPVKGRPGVTAALGEYHPGMPIPINSSADSSGRFWIADPNDDVGGWISGSSIVFGVPNMIYDYDNGSLDPTTYQVTSENTNIIRPVGAADLYASGLYKANQFRKFRDNLVGTDDPTQINASIMRALSPTTYEAANYTIPFPSELTRPELLDTFGFVTGEPDANNMRQVKMYAPLYGPMEDAMYKTGPEIANAIRVFVMAQAPAMDKYRFSMNSVAKRIYTDDPVKYADAARRISNFDFTKNPQDASAIPQSCASIAGTFLWFYMEQAPNNTGCPKSLLTNIEEFYSAASNQMDPTSHIMEYVYSTDPDQMKGLDNFKQLLTGFTPGPLSGATAAGQFASPFPNSADPELMRRTGYSSKLIALKSLTNSGGYRQANNNFAIYSEGTNTALTEDVVQNGFRNALDLAASDVPPTVNH